MRANERATRARDAAVSQSSTAAIHEPTSTELAVDRTRLAHERTLMAWTRTATSLISFGFTVYKFFDYVRKEESGPPAGPLRPRWFALFMIVTGLLALTLATIEHHRALKPLKASYGPQPPSLSLIVAALIAVLGIVGLIAVVFHL